MPRRSTREKRFIATIKRNPGKSFALALGIIGGIPAAWTGVEFWWPLTPISHWSIDHEILPKRDRVLDYLVQQQAIRTLADAKHDMARAPNPTTQATIDRLTKSVARLQDKLDHENGRDE